MSKKNGGKKTNGRNKLGRFVEGNSGGPGNPWVKLTHQFKQALIDSATDERRTQLIEALWDMALGEGDFEDKTLVAKRWAINTILDRMLGKPKESVEVSGEVAMTVSEFFRQAAQRADALSRN